MAVAALPRRQSFDLYFAADNCNSDEYQKALRQVVADLGSCGYGVEAVPREKLPGTLRPKLRLTPRRFTTAPHAILTKWLRPNDGFPYPVRAVGLRRGDVHIDAFMPGEVAALCRHL